MLGVEAAFARRAASARSARVGTTAVGLLESGDITCSGRGDAPPRLYRAVSAGWGHSCGLLESGEIKCWGGQQVRPKRTRRPVVSVRWALDGITAADCGSRASWSAGGAGEFGRPDAPEGRFSAISVGLSYACVVRESGAVECWGGPNYGQADAPEGRFVAISAGDYETCGLREAGAIECWGGEPRKLRPAGWPLPCDQRGQGLQLRAAGDGRHWVLGVQPNRRIWIWCAG